MNKNNQKRRSHQWFSRRSSAALGLLGGALLAASGSQAFGQIDNGLISYWPLDEVQGTKTPDLVSFYDMELVNLTADDLVDGKHGKAFSFSNERQTLLQRVHEPDDNLPANKHESYTLSMWVNVTGEGQNDLRVFSEGNTSNSNPLFNIGTHNGGADGSVDFFFRQTGWDTYGHAYSTQQPFDGTWHHIAFVQADGVRTLYVDGVADALEIADKPEGDWLVNNTSIGGILRAAASHWVTGLIDDVAIWNRALSETELGEIASSAVGDLIGGGEVNPLAVDLVAHWPLNEIQGTKTPDVVSGYDMEITNLTEEDVVPGREGNGNAFSFSNERQTLLSRVHDPADNLPANKHESYTLTMWVNVTGEGQNDLRVFSEGNTSNSNPLFNIGTHSGGTDGSVDFFFRQTGWDTYGHAYSSQQPFDGTWHHIAFVQSEGVRTLFVDGVADELEIADKPEGDWLVNNTSIGGILRAAASHWVTGLIDEVAVWSRALSEEEVNTVKDEGVPPKNGGGGPVRPLAVSFAAEYSSVARGDNVVLQWDASPDATLWISHGVGDVTANSEFGVGSVSVPVEGTSNFTIYASRGDETISANALVTVYEGVNDGWSLIENFETLTAGESVNGQGRWKNPDGVANVVDTDTPSGNALTFEGTAISALLLGSKTLKEGESASLFFRLFGTESDVASITSNVGLSEKPIRFIGDFDQEVGPFVQFNDLELFGVLDMFAINGFQGTLEFSPVPVEYETLYNVWIDVENRGLEDGDLYSVYIQPAAGGDRTLAFEDYVSDRNPQGSVDLGLPGIDLDTLFISSHNAALLSGQFLVDDFYISNGGLNDGVPAEVGGLTTTDEIIDDTTPPGGGGVTPTPDVAVIPLDGVPAEGTGLDGRYWQAEPKAIANLQDFGGDMDIGLRIVNNWYPTGTFKATGLNYQGGNDLTEIREWLQDDGESYVGADGDMNEGLLSFTGYIRIDSPGEVAINSASDDGSVIWIAGEKVVDNDGSHGAPGPSPDGTYNFEAAGLYPIEIAYFNGNWTNDAGEHGGANLAITADGNPIPTQILYGAADVGATAIAASSIATEAGDAGLHGAYWTTEPKGLEFGEGGQGPIFQTVPGDDHGLAMFGTQPQGRFISTDINYTGHTDVTPILEWLGDDSASFIGTEGELNDGLFQFTGFLNVTEAGQHSFSSSSDDGSVVRIGNQIVVNNDGGHGQPGPAPDGSAFFPVAGLYPIEVAYFNGNWTNDAGDHGGANIEMTMNGGSLADHILQPLGGLPPIVAQGGISSIALAEDGMVVIEFEGTLKSSESATGPYTDVEGAVSPYSVAAEGAARFFIAE